MDLPGVKIKLVAPLQMWSRGEKPKLTRVSDSGWGSVSSTDISASGEDANK